MNDYKPGDIVTLEHQPSGASMVNFTVEAVGSLAAVRSLWQEEPVYLGDLPAGWRVTKHTRKADVLPVEPGYYLSARPGDWIFRLDHEGHWTLLNTNSLFPVRDGHLQGHLPFTRLVPEQ